MVKHASATVLCYDISLSQANDPTSGQSFVGETSHIFGARYTEHKSEDEKASFKAFTWAIRKASLIGSQTKSAITTHVMDTYHVVGWNEASIIRLGTRQIQDTNKGLYLDQRERPKNHE